MRCEIKNKTAQFYLIAAVVIVVVLFGTYAITTYVKSRSNPQTEDTIEELNLEGESFINYGIFSNKDLNAKLTEFMKAYGDYVDEEFIFIYSNEELLASNQIKVFSSLNVEVGRISVASADLTITERMTIPEDMPFTFEGGVAEVTIGGRQYPFELKEGQNFFFILKQPIQE